MSKTAKLSNENTHDNGQQTKPAATTTTNRKLSFWFLFWFFRFVFAFMSKNYFMFVYETPETTKVLLHMGVCVSAVRCCCWSFVVPLFQLTSIFTWEYLPTLVSKSFFTRLNITHEHMDVCIDVCIHTYMPYWDWHPGMCCWNARNFSRTHTHKHARQWPTK